MPKRQILIYPMLDAGVEEQCQRYLGVTHGFFQLGGISLAGRKAIQEVATILSN